MTAGTPNGPDEAPLDRATRIIAQSLAQGLMEAEVIIAADREARAQAMPPALMDSLERFGGVLARLVEHTEHLAMRMAELTEAVAELAEARSRAPAATGLPREQQAEPAFPAGGEGVDVAIASVPGFQELMDLQRALVRLPNVQSAAVRRYQDDEAAIQLVLAQPASGEAIASAVSEATQHRIIVEEARPESLQLRLRFLT